ncbi:MAG: phenylalanine--tRNA ligase subunit beta [Firmicutes bacterium]|nr:phenylalanine--tRNA ligase subunit beta [Bacillota bacterium]
MLVPYEWLKEFVPGLPPADEVARVLTMAGVAVEALTGEGEDAVFDFEITHNRPDLLSVFGIAREAAAVFSLPLRHPELAVPEEGDAAEGMASVEIAAPDLCRRYIARIVTDVKIGPSPGWMQARLASSGVRSINNIVDVTNYVMLEVGQPLHAFDLDLVGGRRIVVRRAAPGESITTIDGEERRLSEDMLVIADADRPVAVAGVMGGLETEVSERTKAVLLESANFDGVSVWRTSRALRMRTEASSRFSRGLWPENARIGVDRAAALIAAIGAGKIARGMLDAYPGREAPVYVTLRPRRVNHLLGTDIPAEEMKDILMRLGFIVEPQDGDSYRVLVPDHRRDVSREEDLVEEIARLHGYDRIEPTLPKGAPPEVRLDPARQLALRAGEILRACGLSEVETITFTNLEACRELRLPEDEVERRAVKISNPLSSDYTMMRTTLLTSLLDVLKRNAARRGDDVAIYEIARVYLRREREDAPGSARGDGLRSSGSAGEDLLPCEPTKIGLAVMGRIAEPSWERRAADAGFFDLKGIVETLLEGLGVRGARFVAAIHPSLHPGRTARVVVAGDGDGSDADIGFLGELHPDVREAFGLRKRACVAELDLAGILAAREPVRRVKPLARFPAVTRDMAIVVRRDVPSSEVRDVMAAAGTGLVEDLRLFDVYEGPQVPEGHKSLAFSITYRSPERTLTDEEVEKAHRAISTALTEKLGATVRE